MKGVPAAAETVQQLEAQIKELDDWVELYREYLGYGDDHYFMHRMKLVSKLREARRQLGVVEY
jgi:hypothetical protein